MPLHPPPRLAASLLRWLTPVSLREAVLGDLEEEFHEHCRGASPGAARSWYWQQVIRSSPHLVALLMRASRALAVLVAVTLGYATLGLLTGIFFAVYRQAYALNLFQDMIVLALAVRLGLEMLALATAGALAGLVLASATQSGRSMAIWVAGLLAMAIFAPILMDYLTVDIPIARDYLAARMGLGLPVLATALWLGRRARRAPG